MEGIIRFPWMVEALDDWNIIGMNHYKDHYGRKCLFVAMGKDGRYIQSEGEAKESDQVGMIWKDLAHQAQYGRSL